MQDNQKFQKLKTIVADVTDKMRSDNPLLVGAQNGTLDRHIIEVYLQNLFYTFHNTPISMKEAIAQAKKENKPTLLEFFFEKDEDEEGHEYWAQNDLKSLGMYHETILDAYIPEKMKTLIEYGREIIREDVDSFLAYMFAFEYFTVLVGGELAENLEKKCNIPQSSFTGVVYHVELDVEHVDDDLAAMGNVIKTEQQFSNLCSVAQKTIEMIDDAFADFFTVAPIADRAENARQTNAMSV